jgi:hypothetical protein
MDIKYLAGYEPASIEEAKALQNALAHYYNVLLEEEITLSNFNKTFYLIEHRPPGSFACNYRLILGHRRDGVAPYKSLAVFLSNVKQIAEKSFPGPRYVPAENVAQEIRETYHTAMQPRTPIGNSVPQERLRIKVDGSINPSWDFEQQLVYLERLKVMANRQYPVTGPIPEFEMKFLPTEPISLAKASLVEEKTSNAYEQILVENRLKRKYK